MFINHAESKFVINTEILNLLSRSARNRDHDRPESVITIVRNPYLCSLFSFERTLFSTLIDGIRDVRHWRRQS
jgi:hypothetical protein